jgi:predicted site-specific integrase-resolvase
VRRGADGSPVIIEVNSNPLYDEHGKIRGAVTVERDVTVKTQLAKALEEEARRTAELYERVSTEAERLERMVQERTAELLALQEARARTSASGGRPTRRRRDARRQQRAQSDHGRRVPARRTRRKSNGGS